MTDAKRLTQTHFTAPILEVLESVAQLKAQSALNDFELRPLNPVRVLVAYSGGRDSAALLDAMVKLYRRPHQSLIATLAVAHVEHGLSEHAEEWVAHCEETCAKYNVQLHVEHVFVNRHMGIGLEAAARQARYRALVKIARREGLDVIVTAHHADDALETFLIEWMRGAGPDGLGSMVKFRPIGKDDEDITLCRPWLDISRSEINTYVSRCHLKYVEDDSNADTKYLRNLIRNDIFPSLDKAREGWRQAAQRSLSLLQETRLTLQSVASEDLGHIIGDAPNKLRLQPFRELSNPRQALALRAWLAQLGIRAPSKAKLDDALRQIRDVGTDTHLLIRFEGKVLRRYAGNLIVTEPPATKPILSRDQEIVWSGESEIGLPRWGGVLQFLPCAGNEEGFDAELLRQGPLWIKARKGGEKIKLHALRPSRGLKVLFQSAGVAPFARDLPLVWLGEKLIFVPGLGAEIRSLADADLVPERIRLVWLPDKALI